MIRRVLPASTAILYSFAGQSVCSEAVKDDASRSSYQYLIIGCGIAGLSAAKEIVKDASFGRDKAKLLIVEPNASIHGKIMQALKGTRASNDAVQITAQAIKNISCVDKLVHFHGSSTPIGYRKCLIAGKSFCLFSSSSLISKHTHLPVIIPSP
jgi:hypothetical protein